MQQTSRWLLAIGLGLSLAGCMGPAKGQQPQNAESKEVPKAVVDKGMRVETAVIGVTNASLSLNLPGEVQGSRDALLGTATGGLVERVRVVEGQKVSAGQTLVEIDTATRRLALEQAEAQYEQSSKDLARAEGLGTKISEAAKDRARTDERLAKLAVDSARLQLSRAIINAPFSGVVAQVGVEQGEIAGPGAPVLRLVKLSPVKISLSVSDRDVVTLKEGMPVMVMADARALPVEGVIKMIGQAANLQTRSFMVEVEVPNADKSLLPGMIAKVRMSGEVDSEAVVVPQDYLVTRLDGLGMYLNQDGAAVWRPVVPGAVVGDQIVIAQGLSQGDEVVISGHRELAEGDPLIVARSGRCCSAGRTVFAGAH